MHLNINDLVDKYIEIDVSQPFERLSSIGLYLSHSGHVKVVYIYTDNYGTMRSENIATLEDGWRLVKEAN